MDETKEEPSLCAACLAEFRALKFNPSAELRCNIMPYCCIYWSDELPELRGKSEHGGCNHAIMQLIGARKSLWQDGAVSPGLVEAWAHFHILLPEWPGFQRLEISAKDRAALEGCAREYEDIMGAIAKDFPNVKVTAVAPGVNNFVATRVAQKRKPWWRFW